jgi:hypothetical protein
MPPADAAGWTMDDDDGRRRRHNSGKIDATPTRINSIYSSLFILIDKDVDCRIAAS